MKFLDYNVWMQGYKTEEEEKFYRSILEKMEKAYEEVKPKTSKEFIKIFEAEERFHDMNLTLYKMYALKKENRYVLNIDIQIGSDTDYKLVYEEVDSCMYRHCPEAMSEDYCLCLEDAIGECAYSELYEDEGFTVHNIMLIGGAEINIKCKDIKVYEI